MKNGTSTTRATGLPKLDATDRKIIGELTADGRVSFAELGRRVSLSSPAVAERVQRLERSGVITGYRAEIDPRMLGYQLTASSASSPRRPAAENPRARRRNPRDRRVPSHHRRGLLLPQTLPPLDRRPGRPPRPLPRLRRDHDLADQCLAGATPRPAARRAGLGPKIWSVKRRNRAVAWTDRRPLLQCGQAGPEGAGAPCRTRGDPVACRGNEGRGGTRPRRHARRSSPTELIIGLAAGVSDAESTQLLAAAGAQSGRKLRRVAAKVARVDPARLDAVLHRLRSDPRVRFAEPNYKLHALATPTTLPSESSGAW